MSVDIGAKTVRIHVFVTEETRDEVERVSVQYGMSLSEVTRRAMEFALGHMKLQDWVHANGGRTIPHGPGRRRGTRVQKNGR